MKIQKIGCFICAAVLLFSVSACNGRELPPYIKHPVTTTTGGTTSTTAARYTYALLVPGITAAAGQFPDLTPYRLYRKRSDGEIMQMYEEPVRNIWTVISGARYCVYIGNKVILLDASGETVLDMMEVDEPILDVSIRRGYNLLDISFAAYTENATYVRFSECDEPLMLSIGQKEAPHAVWPNTPGEPRLTLLCNNRIVRLDPNGRSAANIEQETTLIEGKLIERKIRTLAEATYAVYMTEKAVYRTVNGIIEQSVPIEASGALAGTVMKAENYGMSVAWLTEDGIHYYNSMNNEDVVVAGEFDPARNYRALGVYWNDQVAVFADDAAEPHLYVFIPVEDRFLKGTEKIEIGRYPLGEVEGITEKEYVDWLLSYRMTVGLPDPDPVMTLEEYLRGDWFEEEQKNGIGDAYESALGGFKNYRTGQTIVALTGTEGDRYRDENGDPITAPGSYVGIAYSNEERYYTVRALRLSESEIAAPQRNHRGYTYLALGNEIYRYAIVDLTEKHIYTADGPIYALVPDRYAVHFVTADGLYRLFRPTGQAERLTTLDGTQVRSLMYYAPGVFLMHSEESFWYLHDADKRVPVQEAYDAALQAGFTEEGLRYYGTEFLDWLIATYGA